jgi:hypothetical protein
MNQDLSTPLAGPSVAPDFKQVRKYLRTIQQREALGRFIKAGWSPTELGEAARQVFLASARTYPTATSYQYLMEKGPEHNFAQELISTFRAPGYVLPPFNRPVPCQFAWDHPDNPEHSPELRADIVEMARLWRNREAHKHVQPWPTEAAPIPEALWRKLFKIRNRYHSLDDTLYLQGLHAYVVDTKADVETIARRLAEQRALRAEATPPAPDRPITPGFWVYCFELRASHASLEEALERLAEYR